MHKIEKALDFLNSDRLPVVSRDFNDRFWTYIEKQKRGLLSLPQWGSGMVYSIAISLVLLSILVTSTLNTIFFNQSMSSMDRFTQLSSSHSLRSVVGYAIKKVEE
ncbi:MAG: hypothetical protein GF384_00895 [Elusimicrobia bacterium]|nr:hypothetical protein [Elusimicrobiota bacterium]MBD3411610.1 hypothetical protein [Elusimicrobiota bacterium]